MEKITSKMPYQCIKCSKSFLEVGDILRHVKEDHDEDIGKNLGDFDYNDKDMLLIEFSL